MKKIKNQKVKSKKNSLRIFCSAVGMLFILSACGGEPETPVQTKNIDVSQKRKQKQIEKSAGKEKDPSKEVVAYHYDPTGKKDPFKPLVREEKKIQEILMMEGPLTPLQKYDLNDLMLVAVVVGIDKNKAMVEDSKGDGYIIEKGTFVGNKYGQVIEINENEVVIIEKEINPSTGEIIEKETSLILHKPEEEEL